MELLTISLLAGVLAALIATAATIRIKTQSTKLERLEQEHTKRRAELRELANSLTKAAVANDTQTITVLCSQLSLNLNPADSEDAALIQAAEALGETEEKSARLKEFTERMALLLRFDQDKKFSESNIWFNRGKQPRRTPYSEFKVTQCQPTESRRKWGPGWQVAYYFGMLTFSAGILFVLTAVFAGPFQNLVNAYNDPGNQIPAKDWMVFTLVSIGGASVWTAFYLWFKASEKRILEVLFHK